MAFADLPDSARVWIFAADRELQGSEAVRLREAVDQFLEGWKAHGAPLRAASEWRYGRFLMIGADRRRTPPSGCSIDALMHAVRQLEGPFGVRFLGHETVWYRDNAGRIRGASRPEFRRLARGGQVTRNSVVFDNALAELADVRSGRWEGPAADHWHAAFFE